MAPFAERADAGRLPNGRFGLGNVGALKHGVRSEQVAAGALLPPGAMTPSEIEAAVLSDLGDVATIPTGLVRRYAHLVAIAEWLESNMRAQGVMTSKGRARASVSMYLGVADRLVRLGGLLGLERRQKQLGSLEDVQRAVERVNS